MRNTGWRRGNARGWRLTGVSPKALSLMPAEPLGEGGNSAVLPSLGQVATSKSDTLETEISILSAPPRSPPVTHVSSSSLDPGDAPPMTSVPLSALDQNRLRFLVSIAPKAAIADMCATVVWKTQSWLAIKRKSHISAFTKCLFSACLYLLYIFWLFLM